jgi:aspartyl-tRNA(Asn)/glutamyl-tRNA(Gln) amidotransferase subunit C
MDRPKLDVRHVAKLASLSLTEAEEEKLAGELDAIVRYVEQLGTLDTAGVEPTTSVASGGVAGLREDEPRAGLSREEALDQAPRVENDGFAVPTFVEQR